MHILTIMLLSRLLKGKQNKPFKGFREVVEIKHAFPGRIRFYVPTLKNNPEACLSLKEQLSKAEVISELVVNPVTGSLLIVYQPDATEETTLTGVVIKLLGLEKEVEKEPQPMLGKELTGMVKSLNTSIYEYSDGLMDLSDLVTISFFSLGAYSMLRNPRMLPSGLSMIYWAYRTISVKMGQSGK